MIFEKQTVFFLDQDDGQKANYFLVKGCNVKLTHLFSLYIYTVYSIYKHTYILQWQWAVTISEEEMWSQCCMDSYASHITE